MTDDGVLDEASLDGFELEERACRDAWVWGSAAEALPSGKKFAFEPRHAARRFQPPHA